ncbi:MAG: hypothetical protein NWE80_03630, partial [Candidatus Bathyarchaeota archaeon]|nr:hypothetical protein [Candidatus Bathyarchaeota archaeon]
IWLESIVFRFFAPFFPWLESNQLLIIAMTLGVYLAILARFIIQEATTPIKEAFATIYLYDGGQPRELHYRFNGDVIRWLESKPYWVFRYVFRWRGELTLKKKGLLPIIHFPEDWERVEVWLDARTGAVEWIVSDYHWRELWYKAEPNLRSIHLWIYPNFHTLLPLNIETQGKGVLKDLYVEAHPLWHAFKSHLEKHAALHPDSWIARQMESRSSIVTGRLSKLWWDKWRYPLGANSNSYKNNEQPPTVGEQPSLPYARA